MLLLEAVGVREYCCTADEVGWPLCASRAFSESNGSTNPPPSELVALGLAESRQSHVRKSCTQPRAAKAIAGAAVVGGIGSIPRAAAVV